MRRQTGHVDHRIAAGEHHYYADGGADHYHGPAPERQGARLAKTVTRLHEKMDKTLLEPGSVNLTRAKMTSYANTLRACSRELARIGSPGERLQPVYVIVKQACGTFDSGAKCWARAASVSMADGGVFAGSPEERTQARAIECGSTAAGNGTNLLSDADTKGKEIKARFG